ncbi:MAG TPA: acetyl-CoA carboxylase biotin carboxyl carrier protein [Steroidobacteraceae bacterium]|nr:acetyl-CoA carboxylase biotin carboxyl carrier protein [Steroidobacteraceae bacterium]
MPLTAQDVAEITRLLEQSDFLELRLEHEGFKLTLKRASPSASGGQAGAGAAAATTAAPWPPPALAHSPWPAAEASAPREPRSEGRGSVSDASLQEVTAPLLGIFYRAARPGAAAYVEVGSEVHEDTVIGIIEVMKLMNSVRADVRGTVVEILVADGATVEYGQVLLRVSREAHRG